MTTRTQHDSTDDYTVRTLANGELLASSTHASATTAEARYDSTVSYYRRSDPIDGGVSVQLIDRDGDSVLHEQQVDAPAA